MKKLFLTIGWLYPDFMSTYGDRGNIFCIIKRCKWREIAVKVVKVEKNTTLAELGKVDLVIGGGAQDRQQKLVIDDLFKNKKKVLKRLFQSMIPGLFVCGSPQLLGKYYMTGDGQKLQGLGIFDFITKHFGLHKSRCIGDTVGEIVSDFNHITFKKKKTIVGFENHGGRTYLGKVKPFAKVLHGYGNNGKDGFEGAVYKNVIACYYHGPFLPKNPHVADWLIKKALEVKYKKKVILKILNDDLEWKAHNYILKRYNIKS